MGTELPFKHIDAMDWKWEAEEDIAVAEKMQKESKANTLLIEVSEEAQMIQDKVKHNHEQRRGTND